MPPRQSKRPAVPAATTQKALAIAREQKQSWEAAKGKKTACDPRRFVIHEYTPERLADKADDGEVEVRTLRLEQQDDQAKMTTRVKKLQVVCALWLNAGDHGWAKLNLSWNIISIGMSIADQSSACRLLLLLSAVGYSLEYIAGIYRCNSCVRV